MPKILIREYDNTRAGNSLYANFSVLVPGPAKAGATCFDENDIYEVSSQKDFEDNVGLIAGAGCVQAAAAIPPTILEETYFKATEAQEDDPETEEDESAAGSTAQEQFIAYIRGLAADEGLYLMTPNVKGDEGYLRNAENIFTRVTEDSWEASYETIDELDPVYFAVINKETGEGQDAQNGDQYGNQIAYELLGLGYTVLYKKLEKLADLDDDDWWAPLKDKSVYDFRYVINGKRTNNVLANKAITKLAHFNNSNEDVLTNGRGDCVALCDLDENVYANLKQNEAIAPIKTELNRSESSKYAAIFAPYVIYDSASLSKYDAYENAEFPASFHYLACAAKASENYNEWYANAGYTRGVCSFKVNGTGCKFGEIAVNALEPRNNKGNLNKALNIIVTIKGNYYLWGNRTAFELDAEDLRASHFLNIRQLCSTLKKQIYITCRKYTYDPNSDLLWGKFCADIRPLLEQMKGDQGITDYKFIKIKTDKKALLKAKIRIVPIEAVEDFDISLTLEDSIAGVVAGIDEQ